MPARDAFEQLPEPWRVALAEAWASWSAGSAGVGAVITDADGAIVATGRNRMLDARTEPGVLASTFLAHAEMNALARLPLGSTEQLTMWTTFEPCLMCASAIVQSRIPRLHYATADPVFDGMHDWFAALPFASDRLPERAELGGRVGAFAHVLHVSWLSFWVGEGPVLDAHRRLRPAHLDVALEVVQAGELARLASAGATVADALDALWEPLEQLAPAVREGA